jgi:hypothetical protein
MARTAVADINTTRRTKCKAKDVAADGEQGPDPAREEDAEAEAEAAEAEAEAADRAARPWEPAGRVCARSAGSDSRTNRGSLASANGARNAVSPSFVRAPPITNKSYSAARTRPTNDRRDENAWRRRNRTVGKRSEHRLGPRSVPRIPKTNLWPRRRFWPRRNRRRLGLEKPVLGQRRARMDARDAKPAGG